MASSSDFKYNFVSHKGFNLISGTHDPAEVDAICNYEVRDSDVFVVTYPKSGEDMRMVAEGTIVFTSCLSSSRGAKVCAVRVCVCVCVGGGSN